MVTIKISPSSHAVMDVRVYCESCYKRLKEAGSLVNWKDYAALQDVKRDPNAFADRFNNDAVDGSLEWPDRTRRMIEKLIGLAS